MSDGVAGDGRGMRRLRVGVRIEARGKQRTRIGLARRFENLPHRAEFHHLSPLHDHDMIGKVPHHRQVMSDEDEGQAHIAAKLIQEQRRMGTAASDDRVARGRSKWGCR